MSVRDLGSKVLVIDVGGTHVKALAKGQSEERMFDSGPTLTPRKMVSGVRRLVDGWEFDQALGNYRRGKMLFLGLGTGLGSALIVGGIVEPTELGHLPYRKGTFEDYVGSRGLKEHGKKMWRHYVEDVVEGLRAAMEPDEVVKGGGNSRKLKSLPRGCRIGDDAKAFLGGFRLWRT